MPKPMTMTIEVEEIAFGKVFRTLDGMPGVINIKITGSGPRSAKPNGASSGTKHGSAHTVPAIVLGELKQHGNLGREPLGAALERNGKRPTSLPDALMKLKKAKAIKTRGRGRDTEYTITPAGVKQFETAKSNSEGVA